MSAAGAIASTTFQQLRAGGSVVIYAIVSLLAEEQQQPQRKFLSRTHAEHVCAQLNRSRAGGHPGYAIEELNTLDPGYDGNVEC
jgi:hypothetical protein